MSTAANKIQNPDEIVLELTQAEIWDDSMLVEAWDEAMGEYKVSYVPGEGELGGASVRNGG